MRSGVSCSDEDMMMTVCSVSILVMLVVKMVMCVSYYNGGGRGVNI